MNARSADLAAYALLAGAALVGLLLWGRLPDRMAIHFGTSGVPDSFVAKPLGVILAPAVGLAGVLVTRYAPDWLRRSHTTPEVENLAVVFLGAVIAYTQGFVYAWNLGYRLDAAVVAVPVLVAAFALVAYSYTRGYTAG
jgi:uncharacterized membrane protein